MSRLFYGKNGQVINADNVRSISSIMFINNNDPNFEFEVYYNALKKDDAYYVYRFYLKDYNDSKEELKIKVENIRLNLIKFINNDVEPFNPISSLNLKKK